MSLPIPKFKVLLFGPELPAAGVRARMCFEHGVLVVAASRFWSTAAAESLALDTGGYDGRQWVVSWPGPQGEFRAILQSEAAMEALVELAPADRAARLHRVRRQLHGARQRTRLALGLAALLVFMSMFALSWYWLHADSFSRWAAQRVSVAQEVRLGERLMTQLDPRWRQLPPHAVAHQVVEGYGVRLSAGSAMRYHFHVVEDQRALAFALPGGHVVVHTGLLRAAESGSEVAGVLARQISHVELRHALHASMQTIGLPAVLAALGGDVTRGLWHDAAAGLTQPRYSSAQHAAADRMAVELLVRAGLPSQGLLSLLERVRQEDGLSDTLVTDAPATPERIALLRQMIAAQGDYPRKCLHRDWERLRAQI